MVDQSDRLSAGGAGGVISHALARDLELLLKMRNAERRLKRKNTCGSVIRFLGVVIRIPLYRLIDQKKTCLQARKQIWKTKEIMKYI